MCDFVRVCSTVWGCGTPCVRAAAPRGQSGKQAKVLESGTAPRQTHRTTTSFRAPQSRQKVTTSQDGLAGKTTNESSFSYQTLAGMHTFIKKWVILTCITNPIQNTQRVDTMSFQSARKYTQESYEGETKTQHCKRL